MEAQTKLFLFFFVVVVVKNILGWWSSYNRPRCHIEVGISLQEVL